MKTSLLWVSMCLPAFLGVSIAACSSDVAIDTSAGSASASSGSGGTCLDPKLQCVTDCAGSASPVEPSCTSGAWTCPEGTFSQALCFHDPQCPDFVRPCEHCKVGDGKAELVCDPSADCLAECPEIACSDCSSGPITVKGCSCSCNDAGQLKCSPQICCMEDFDCGDETYAPCVNGVCKQPVLDGCWKSSECGPNTSCIEVFVCPCGEDCDVEDKPGFCEGPGP